MKLLVATKETQGVRANDFHGANENEIVVFSFECDTEIDGSCGCCRGMTGVDSGRGTTTFKVIKSDWTLEDIKTVFLERYKKIGIEADEAEEMAEESAKDLAEVANQFSIGQIIERRGYDFQVRSI